MIFLCNCLSYFTTAKITLTSIITKYRYNIVNTNTMKQRQTTIYFFRHLFYLSLVRSLGEDLGASEVCKRVMAIVTGVCLEPPTLRLSLVLTPLATQSSSFVLLARNNGSQWKASVSNVNQWSVYERLNCRVLVQVAEVALVELLSNNKICVNLPAV